MLQIRSGKSTLPFELCTLKIEEHDGLDRGNISWRKVVSKSFSMMKFFCGLDVNRSGNVFIEMQSFKMTVFEQPLTDESIQSFGFFFCFIFK